MIIHFETDLDLNFYYVLQPSSEELKRKVGNQPHAKRDNLVEKLENEDKRRSMSVQCGNRERVPKSSMSRLRRR